MYKKENGFTLYISIVISAAVLLGSYAISNTLFNQQVLFNDFEESQKAFMIADAGVECAQHYDEFLEVFDPVIEYKGTINCGDSPAENDVSAIVSTIDANDRAKIGGVNESVFEVRAGDLCAYVTVKKVGLPDPDNNRAQVVSRGYNTCEPGSPRRVERTVRATY